MEKIIDDTNPYNGDEEVTQKAEDTAEATTEPTAIDRLDNTSNSQTALPNGKPKRGKRNTEPRTSMSFFTAIALSFNNLLTKKTRSLLTSFAGSIGIIGIAIILYLSTGIQAYISALQQDALSSYPIAIERNYMDYSQLMNSFTYKALNQNVEAIDHPDGSIYSSSNLIDIMENMKNLATNSASQNNLKEFKKYLESDGGDISKYTSGIQYVYNVDINAYMKQTDAFGETYYTQANPSTVFSDLAEGLKSSDNATASFMASYIKSFSSSYLLLGRNAGGN